MKAETLDAIGQAQAWLKKATELINSDSVKPPTPPNPSPKKIVVPHEKDVAAFYGAASSDPGYLDWFNFPVSDARLYTRTGDAMTDHDKDPGGLDDHRTHKKIAPDLAAALLAIYTELGKEQFYSEGWHVYGGSHNYRSKKSGGGLSMHAYGVAVDFNVGENPLFSRTTTFSTEAVAIMERFGFLWGPRMWGTPENQGNSGNIYFDPMHFQRAVGYFSNPGVYYAKNGLPGNVQLWEG